MNFQETIPTELKSLYSALCNWCNYLSENKYSNFAETLQLSFNKLHDSFTGNNEERYEALLNFQDMFKGGMGSINDISIDDIFLRQSVEKERDLLIRKYYDLVCLKVNPENIIK
ncbi:MAG: hypothetical protein JNL74_11945 [Fibrobacteres bacterium]|nr:hypothetical protein [Fibrobacterota bacterium]